MVEISSLPLDTSSLKAGFVALYVFEVFGTSLNP